MTFISTGDFVDSWHFLSQKGLYPLLRRFQPLAKDRVIETWKCIDREASDWWIIPAVRQRWNEMISGGPGTIFQDHVLNTFFAGKKGLKVLSIGSGGGTAEILFGKRDAVDKVLGMDLSPGIVKYSTGKAVKEGLPHVKFICTDAMKFHSDEKFDVLLFNSSLHHFRHIGKVLDKTRTFLREDGLLVFNEYTGPDRFQWSREQLEVVNEILESKIPQSYKKLHGSPGYKKKCYRPGLFRTMISDPSESVNSSKLVGEVEKRFKRLQLTHLGGNILHILLKDISHHFTGNDEQTNGLLRKLFYEEDHFLLTSTSTSTDFSFGVYQNNSANLS